MQYYCQHALAPATRQLYTTGQRHFHNFCRLHARPLGPADDAFLAEFVAYLADVAKITPTSIKTYLSALRSLHIDRGWPDPLQSAPLTQRVLAGVKRVHGLHPRRQRLPVSRPTLVRLIEHLRTAPWLLPTDKLMLTAACTLAFHGFLRCSELTTGLARSSARIIAAPLRHIELRVPASKTDPFRRGATITIGASGGLCCPVSNLSQYLDATRGRPVNTPLFAYSSGLPLTRPVFTQQIQRALLEAGVPDSHHYMSHSFRIGAATAAAEAGIPAWLIKTMGRWSSEAYLVYIRTPLATRLSVAERLTPATQTSTSRPLGPRTPCNPDLPS